jgi:hypothetical protein
VPTEIGGAVGSKIVCRFSPGMESTATIAAWEPPHRFAAESDPGPDTPAMVTEWIVEAAPVGASTVRVVHSLVAETDEYDVHLAGAETGWPAFFEILRLYLTHFRGLTCAAFRVMGAAPGPASQAWQALGGALGLSEAARGDMFSAEGDAPPLAGVVESAGNPPNPYQAVLRLEQPAPGIVQLLALPMSGQVYLTLSFYLYGDRAAEYAKRDEPRWQAWIADRFG